MRNFFLTHFRLRRSDVDRLLVGSLAAGLIGGFFGAILQDIVFADDQPVAVVTPAPVPPAIPQVTRVKRFLGIEQDFAVRAAVERATPSLVSIGRASTEGSLGSGVVLTSDGWILSSAAVLDTAGKNPALVVSHSGGTSPVKTIVVDGASGAVFLKIDGQNLAVAALGSSEDQLAGQLVVALQSQQRVKVTSLESTHHRASTAASSVSSEKYSSGFLLADSIDGYLGGPVLNLEGEVIGLVNGPASVIPTDQFRLVVPNVLRSGVTRRPMLALQTQLTALGEAGQWAAKVVRPLTTASPAVAAGIRLDDLIVSVEGQRITQQVSLASLVQQYQPGDSINLEIERAGKRSTLAVKLGELKK